MQEKYFDLNAELNVTDQGKCIERHLYSEIPYHYVLKNYKWVSRVQGKGKVVSRMYTVRIADEERFYLRLILLHVRGATSFEDLRKVNGIQYGTFKEAAIFMGLLDTEMNGIGASTNLQLFKCHIK